MIPQNVIDRICDLDIVRIIEDEGISLKKKGTSWECCCPFHNEKTPSFIVTPSKNLYKCFGCGEGGNVISFIMKFRNLEFLDAVEYLAEKHGIEYEKKEPTAEEREARFRQEQLLIVNKAAQDFFSSRMEAPAAVEYCKKRDWDKDLIDVFHIGFAPGANQLLKTLTKAGYKKDILLKAGLIKQNQDNGDYYDTFRNRIVFPITDKSGRILGFSGRDITGKNDTPKYLNTAETEIFTKGKQLFGYYQAYREIANTETVFLVEGNPDVVRMYEVGAENTVAPLGTALTDDQVKELAKKARTFVLVGDNDKSGVEAVIDHGKKIIQMGLNCRIMPIIEGKDPDEYFSIRKGEFKEYYRNEVLDFIPWLTSRLMDGKRSQSEIMPVITEITGLMAYCKDENIVKMYLEQFTRQYKNGSIWRSEYNKAKNTIERMAAKEKGTMDMVANFNFFVRNNCYFGVGANGGDKIWSNFIFKPILHVKDEKNARRIFLMVNNLGQEVVIKLKQSELVSFTDFKTRVESAGNFIWEAGQPELQQLKKYLYSETDSADEIKQLGWQKRFGFFAWGNGGMDAGIFEKANKFGVVTIQDRKYYIPGNALDTIDNTQGYQLMRRFVYAETSSITLNEFAAKLIGVFGDNAKVGLCFLLATLFKDIVTSVTTSFPILNLFGPKGTGKSEMGHALVSFFMPNYEAPNINSSTKAALAEVVAEVSNAIVHLDEYKNNLDLDKREFLKGIWDGTGRSRINLDNDKKRETTAVDSGVIMSGQEMPTADIALFSRLIFLTFSKAQFNDEEKKRFEELQRIQKKGLTHLTAEILKLRSYFQGNFRQAWDEAMSDLNDLVRDFNIEDRTLRNWVTVLAAFRCLEKKLQLPMSYGEMLQICAEGCKDQNAKTIQNNELSGFWDTLDILVSSSKAWPNVDYRILPGKNKEHPIKEGTQGVYLRSDKRYLFLSFKRVASLYSKETRDSGSKSIPVESLRFYLEKSEEFLGTAKSVRFRMVDTPQGYIGATSSKEKVTTAMIFDYDAIIEKYGINIDIITQQADNQDQNAEAPEQPVPPPPVPEISFPEDDED